jgi:uncharacterized protein YbjQ (UPF0145 family)
MWDDAGTVPLFRSNPSAQPTEEELRASEVDLERIRQGGIPLGAEERLKRVASASEPFFTSDLSSKEFALAQASGLQPIAQVMGSSVVKHGWRPQVGGIYGQWSGELRALSDPWNLSRERAFGRLEQEAEFAAADGVIGIEITSGTMGEAGNVEMVVFGTAVRDKAFPNRRQEHGLGLCTLSGQEVDKLRRIGAEVCGVVGYTTVNVTTLYYSSNWIMNSSGWLGGAGAQNIEIQEITQCVYDARRRVMNEVERQARAVHANDIVISALTHHITHHEYDYNDTKHHAFMVTMHILGTAVRLGAHPPHPTPMTGPMMSMNLGD